jgi:hypothetical protein
MDVIYFCKIEEDGGMIVSVIRPETYQDPVANAHHR